MAITIIPGDDHYMALTGVLTVCMQLFFFAIAYLCQFDKVTDFAGSMNFILIVLLPMFAGQAYTPRGVMAVALVVITRAELAVFLLYRVLRRGKDDRFDAIRESLPAFFVFWIFQMVWAFGVSLPVIFTAADPVLTAPALGGRDWAGLSMWAVGFFVQVAADLQKDSFRADPTNKGKVCNVGLWRYSRHPNFFGEILLWWGIFTLCSPQFEASSSSWGYACIISPLLTMLILLKGSGMPTAEGDNQKRFMRTKAARDSFVEYRRVTSPLVPLPQVVYGCLPLHVKRWLLFEWPSYETDWEYCGEAEVATRGAKEGAPTPASPLLQREPVAPGRVASTESSPAMPS